MATVKKGKRKRDFPFDVCLSFANEQRRYVDLVARALRNRGIRVFYDDFQRVEMWGRDLYDHLADVYRNQAEFCVIFASKDYARKVWTSHERRHAQARALRENREYILPARFDRTEIPGIPDTVRYEDLRAQKPSVFADVIAQKLGHRNRKFFVPPVPDKLFDKLKIRSLKKMDTVHSLAEEFVTRLERLAVDERRLLLTVVRYGCPAKLPKNVHIAIDEIRRRSKFSEPEIIRLAGGIAALGFYGRLYEDRDHEGHLGGPAQMIALEFADLRATGPMLHSDELYTRVINEMIGMSSEYYCSDCGFKAMVDGDFSHIASATFDAAAHRLHKPRALTMKHKQIRVS